MSDNPQVIIDQLQHALKHGALLHGSMARLNTISPRQAHDVSGRHAGCQYGVYATEHIPGSIVHAVVHPSEHGSHFRYSCYETHGELHATNVSLAPGYVYIVRRGAFERVIDDDGAPTAEFIAHREIYPLGLVTVSPKLLPLLNIVVEIS